MSLINTNQSAAVGSNYAHTEWCFMLIYIDGTALTSSRLRCTPTKYGMGALEKTEDKFVSDFDVKQRNIKAKNTHFHIGFGLRFFLFQAKWSSVESVWQHSWAKHKRLWVSKHKTNSETLLLWNYLQELLYFNRNYSRREDVASYERWFRQREKSAMQQLCTRMTHQDKHANVKSEW